MTLNELASRVADNSKRWFPHLHDPNWTTAPERLKHMGLGLAEEAGEVVGIIKKATGYKPGQSAHSVLSERDLGSELIDVIVYALNIAADLGIDLDDALVRKTAICDERWG